MKNWDAADRPSSGPGESSESSRSSHGSGQANDAKPTSPIDDRLTGDRLTGTQLTYYDRLGLHPSASPLDIRRSYRELSKQYHPDTTALPPAIATIEFQKLNQAYATLSNPERRDEYDRQLGYASVPIVRPWLRVDRRPPDYDPQASAYLDPSDRPLSSGELFALATLGLAFILCFALVLIVATVRGESLLA